MDNFEIIVNLLIIALLIPTIIFAYFLNKNLTILRQNQSSFANLIKALNDATNKAESSIPKLKSVTEHSSEDLKEVVDSAKNLKDDLLFINERADNLADRLEQVIHNGRNLKDEKKSRTSAQILQEQPEEEPSELKEDEAFQENALNARSEAEIELLKALRAIK